MRKVKFTFSYDNDIWDGYAHGTTWNGFDNVSVDEKEYNRIEEYFGGKIAPILKNSDGLYSYAYGFTTSIISFRGKVKKMNKEEYQERIQQRINVTDGWLVKVTIQRLEDQIQSIWDLIGDLQKGRIDAEDIPEYYKESEVDDD